MPIRALTDTDLDDIATRAASLHEYATLTDKPLQADADQLTGTDVPALINEIRQLRAALTTIRQDMHQARNSGDEWAMEWFGDVWAQLPPTVRAAAGDPEADR